MKNCSSCFHCVTLHENETKKGYKHACSCSSIVSRYSGSEWNFIVLLDNVLAIGIADILSQGVHCSNYLSGNDCEDSGSTKVVVEIKDAKYNF